MRLRDVMLGSRAIKRVELPLLNVPGLASPDQPELASQREADRAALEHAPPGSTPGASSVSVGLRVLTGAEDALVLVKATEYAKANHGTGEFNDPLHGLGVQVYTLALGCVDPDSDPKRPVPFFGEPDDKTLETAAKEILESPLLGRDGIVYLYECHELWRDMCAPQTLRVTPEKFVEIIHDAVLKDDPAGFLALRPGTRWSCFRSMAELYASSQTPKSGPSSSSKSEASSLPVGSA